MKKLFIILGLPLTVFCGCKKSSKNEGAAPNQDVVSTFAGNGQPGYNGGPPGTDYLNGPTGLAFDAAGNLYVADPILQMIVRITPDAVATIYAGIGTGGFENGTAHNSEFFYPEGVAFDKSGNLFVGDSYNNVIRKVAPDGTVSTFAGVPGPTGGYQDGPAISAQFNMPAGIVFDPAGNLYVADVNNGMIRKITPSGTVSTVAGGLSLANPTQPGIDSDGNLYVSNQDPANYGIVKITATGTKSLYVSNVVTQGGLIFDPSGDLYIADAKQAVILKIAPDGSQNTVAGKTGVGGYVNGPVLSAEFGYPLGIALDKSGNLFVADYGTNTIRKVIF